MRIILAVLSILAVTAEAVANDKAGYHYPAITSTEVFDRSLGRPPPADRTVRTNFITELTKAQLEAPAAPQYVVFAKGQRAQHMIILALEDDIFRTLYRARAVLAQLTSNARSTDFFRNNNLQFVATWFDLAKLLGFEDIVISDGVTWSHLVVLRSEK